MAATANIKAVITAEDRASGALRGFGKQVDSIGSSIIAISKRAAVALAGASGAITVLGVKTAADLESARQGFVTLLGSAEDADKTMQRIKKEAARTPFEIPGLTKATQMLTAVTKNGDRALDFILDVGEGLAAMGRGQEELDRIAVNLQQIAATGRAFGIDIRQFAFAGIPIYEMLQKEIGLTGEALQAFIEEGGVTFELLEKMFASASNEGGRWAGAFQKQAGTFNQLVSNMKDSFQIFAADFVKNTGVFDVVKRVVIEITDVFNGNNETLKRWARSFSDVVKTVGDYLMPKLDALWHTIEDDLAPALFKFWDEILKPLIPVIGTTLVVALGFAIDAFKLLLEAISPVINFLAENEGVFWSIVAVLGAIRTALFLQGALAAFKGVMAGVTTSFATTAAIISTPIIMPAIAVAAALAALFAVQQAAFRAWDAVKNAKNAAEGLGQSNRAILKRLQAQTQVPYSPEVQARARAQIKALAASGQFDNMATGGPVMAGVPYTVGEQGRETFVPSQNGTILTNNQSKGLGGGTVYLNITIQAGAFMGSRQETRKYAELIMDAWKDVQMSRGVYA